MQHRCAFAAGMQTSMVVHTHRRCSWCYHHRICSGMHLESFRMLLLLKVFNGPNFLMTSPSWIRLTKFTCWAIPYIIVFNKYTTLKTSPCEFYSQNSTKDKFHTSHFLDRQTKKPTRNLTEEYYKTLDDFAQKTLTWILMIRIA